MFDRRITSRKKNGQLKEPLIFSGDEVAAPSGCGASSDSFS